MSKPWRVNAAWADCAKHADEFNSELEANRHAARLSRSAERGGPACCAIVSEGIHVRAIWHNGKKTVAK